MIASATAIPGVRSSWTMTRVGAIAIRTACRYSSRRCAEMSAVAAMIAMTAIAAMRPALPARILRSVIVGRIAIDGVNVIDAALLRRVFDHQRRALNPEI